MLNIIELRKAMEAAEAAFDAALEADAPRATIRKLEKAMAAAQAAYAKEREDAQNLKAEYEAMGDENGIGETNAGDTFDRATYGDVRHSSTEYWRCAIDSFVMYVNA